jgi:hypothetical protein
VISLLAEIESHRSGAISFGEADRKILEFIRSRRLSGGQGESDV